MDKGEVIMDKDFLFIQELVDCLCGIEEHIVQATQEGMRELLDYLFQAGVISPKSEEALLRTFRSVDTDCICEITSSLQLRYSVYRWKSNGRFLVIGPCREEVFNEKELTRLLRQQHFSETRLRQLLQFCRQQPPMNSETLYRLTSLLVQRITGFSVSLPYRQLEVNWHSADRQRILEYTSFEELNHIRMVEGRYEASAILTEAVKQGNLSLAYGYIQKMAVIPEDLSRNPNPLRNAQNLCIVLNTQLRHALEEQGVSPYKLDQLSGNIGRQIEKFKSVAAINAYFGDIIRQYCALAQEKEQKNLSSFSRLAVTYIKTHLSDNLTVKDAAKALLVNPDYLSNKFHREVGIPFITYVNRERIRQAAALLQRTDLQIQQIASAVGYNNSSYFARQFVAFTGKTPRAYRQDPEPLQW